MRFIIRTVMLIALVWIGLLLSGYGVLIGSKENAARAINNQILTPE